MSKILCIGDMHLKPVLSYSEYIQDGRQAEYKAVLDKIIEASADCQQVVVGGDCLDVKNPPANVIKNFTEFLERFGNDKELFIMSGNHDRSASGESAIDYLREIKDKNWHIITTEVLYHNDMVFCPYFYRQELGVENFEQATKIVMDMLTNTGDTKRRYLFAHLAISDSLTNSGQSTNLFPEVVLKKSQLEKHYEKIFGFHIHKPQENGKTIITGNVFTSEAGDDKKYVFKLDKETGKVEWIPLPCRPIFNFKNPTLKSILETSDKHAIVKCTFTEKSETPIEKFKEELKRFDAYILVENYPSERKKVDMEGATMEFDILSLLQAYSREKNVDFAKLKAAWEEIAL